MPILASAFQPLADLSKSAKPLKWTTCGEAPCSYRTCFSTVNFAVVNTLQVAPAKALQDPEHFVGIAFISRPLSERQA
jgi:hypothetical protein